MEIDKKTIKALSADSRLSILKTLEQRRMMPSELSKRLGLAPSTIVEHLKLLEVSGLVMRQETGHKWIYYQITDKGSSLISPKAPVSFFLTLAAGICLVFAGTVGYLGPMYMVADTQMTGVAESAAPAAISKTVQETPAIFEPFLTILVIGIALIIISSVIRWKSRSKKGFTLTL